MLCWLGEEERTKFRKKKEKKKKNGKKKEKEKTSLRQKWVGLDERVS